LDRVSACAQNESTTAAGARRGRTFGRNPGATCPALDEDLERIERR